MKCFYRSRFALLRPVSQLLLLGLLTTLLTHSIAYAGQVFSFGDSQDGTAGLGPGQSITTLPTPIDETNIANRKIVRIAPGLLLADDGTPFSAGPNFDGRTGLGITEGNTYVYTPIDTRNLGRNLVRGIAAGGNSRLLVTQSGNVYGFGQNLDGELGLRISGNFLTRPTLIDETLIGDSTIVQAAIEDDHALLLAEDGTVFSMGYGSFGKTGIGIEGENYVPTPIDASHFDNKQILEIAVGRDHSIALADDGTVYSFGNNGFGLTGQGTDQFSTIYPEPIDATNLGDQRVVQIAAGPMASLLLTEQGKVFSFGRNVSGLLGLGTNEDLSVSVATPVDWSLIGEDRKITQIAAGRRHNLLLADDGTVFSFGNGQLGQTGFGASEGAFIPTPINMESLNGRRVVQIAAGGDQSMLLTVPEPTTAALALLALTPLAVWRTRRTAT